MRQDAVAKRQISNREEGEDTEKEEEWWGRAGKTRTEHRHGQLEEGRNFPSRVEMLRR